MVRNKLKWMLHWTMRWRLPGQHLPSGESAHECIECGESIPPERRAALPGVQLCISCQEEVDKQQLFHATYNRRGSKDSQLK